MLVSIGGNTASTYDDFKAVLAKLAPNGADVFYKGGSNLSLIYAFVRGEPGCKGEFPVAIATPNDMSSAGISVSGTVLVDFPTAVEVKNGLTTSV